jgi:hypothetical protein
MRDDLLDAQAAIDWAVAQLPTLMARLESWGNGPRYRLVFEPHPEIKKKLIKLADIKQLDPIINAEVGVIINSIRSSLDILITSVALRYGYTNTNRTYFPITNSEADFVDGKYNGKEAIQALPPRERSIIENLKPWRGGNNLLFALHKLDIMRKHQRLIDVRMVPWAIAASPAAFKAGLEFVPGWPGLKNDAVIGWTHIDAPDCNPDMSLKVQFDETIASTNNHLVGALCDFTSLAYAIVKLFD